MIAPLVEAGHRCIAPDLVGFGRSDKLARREDYSYQFHVDIMNGFVRALDLKNITLFGQDWGGLIWLRVLVDNLDRFSRHLAPVTDRQVAELGITLTPQHPERELRAAGALFESSTKMRDFFADHVVVDGRLVTGQNQNAGTETAEDMMRIAGGNPK
jgi:pimeloyl-ACP methyl ester carboxylesterase